ncbi:MAG TPA: hypothetical protein VNL96_01735 [Gemmatimonadaceae bacterium]|nr:hypothetical protein [Gemmatimonadaceae bacterium]
MKSSLKFAAALACLLICRPSELAAHEKGVLRLGSKVVAAGDTLMVRGEKLPRSAPIGLRLRSALDSLILGTVTTDSSGFLAHPVAIPATVRPGSYTLLAVAADGDIVARAEIVVSAAPSAADSPSDHRAHTAATGATSTTGARGIPLARESKTYEWVTILLFSALCAVIGARLLRPLASSDTRRSS